MKNNIAKIRKTRGLTQKELGELVGVDRKTVYRHEKGVLGFSETTLSLYAKALKCTISELVEINQDAATKLLLPEVLARALDEVFKAKSLLKSEEPLLTSAECSAVALLYNRLLKQTNIQKNNVTKINKD